MKNSPDISKGWNDSDDYVLDTSAVADTTSLEAEEDFGRRDELDSSEETVTTDARRSVAKVIFYSPSFKAPGQDNQYGV